MNDGTQHALDDDEFSTYYHDDEDSSRRTIHFNDDLVTNERILLNAVFHELIHVLISRLIMNDSSRYGALVV